MAIVLMESFDHEGSNADLLLKGWNQASVGGFTTGRFGNGWGNNRDQHLVKIFPVSRTTYIVGLAFNLAGFHVGKAFLKWLDSNGALQGELRGGTGNIIYYTRNGTTLATGSTSLSVSTWYYIQWKLTIDNTSGLSEVLIDGNTEISFTGDTQATALNTIKQLNIEGEYDPFNDRGSTFSEDDIYVLDTTGSAPTNDYLGDVRVEALFPNGNGNSSQFIGSDANSTDNYLLVDETAPNGDTDYVESATVSEKDTYAYTNLTPTAGTVYGIQLLPYARKTDAGTRKIASIARLSGTEVNSADGTLSTGYKYFPDIRETKPGGGTWSISDVNSAEFGVEVTA